MLHSQKSSAVALFIGNSFVKARCFQHGFATVEKYSWFNFSSLHLGSQKASFRSAKEAVDAAQDGDQIILLPGIHNGMGYATMSIMCTSKNPHSNLSTCMQ